MYKTEKEIVDIIGSGIQTALSEYLEEVGMSEEEKKTFSVSVASERMFIERVIKPKEEGRMQKDDDANVIYFVIKFGQGQWNFALSNVKINIDCLSESNSLDIALSVLRKFLSDVNYEWLDGMIQTYFEPTVTDAFSEVYENYRALISIEGNLKIPANGLIFVTNILYQGQDDEGNWLSDEENINFINFAFHPSASPDPQCFPKIITDAEGNKSIDTRSAYTASLNKQTTMTVSINTYLFDYQQDSKSFTYAVIQSAYKHDINRKFHLRFVTNLHLYAKDDASVPTGYLRESDTGYVYKMVDGKKKYSYLDWVNSYFVYQSAPYEQTWGDPSAINVVFAEALKEEPNGQ